MAARLGRRLSLGLSILCLVPLSAAHAGSPGLAGADAPRDPKLCPDQPREPPRGFVDLRQAIPSLRFDIRYHTAGNFTGAPIDGYGAPGAWLLEEPARALAKVQRALSTEGLGLVIFDAYRPRRGTDAMVAWAERTNQTALLDGGYIARRSRHNHGTTVDLGLIELATGRPLDMGTDFDTLSPHSHTRAAKGKALKNRLLLKNAMEKEGFRAYFREWWHFQFSVPGSRPRDVPYGQCERDESAAFRAQPAEGAAQKEKSSKR